MSQIKVDEDTAKVVAIALAEIKDAREYSQNPAPHDLFISSETLVSCMASLISPLMNAETAYRKKIRGYIEEGDSNAKAEAKARCDEEYNNWQKLKYVYELAHEQIMLIKKFGTYLQGEAKSY